MKTIEIMSGGHKAEFTTKSLTFNGKEFFYSRMSDVVNDPDKRFYTFTYDDEKITLPYEEGSEKILNAIFIQVQGMQSKHKSVRKENSEAETEGKSDDISQESPDHPNNTDETSVKEPVDTDASSSDPASDESSGDPVPASSKQDEKAAKKAEKEKRKAERLEEKKRKKAEKASAKASKSSERPIESEADKSSESLQEQSADPEKKKRFRKSISIFAIIIVITALLALIYFMVFGTTDSPAPSNPNSVESQTYDDIDELINELQ